jgi:hypothetical protein
MQKQVALSLFAVLSRLIVVLLLAGQLSSCPSHKQLVA